MNLKAIRYRFSQFLKQFRIDDLKLLMKFLELVVNEYKNSKASRLFELLSDTGDVELEDEDNFYDDDDDIVDDDLVMSHRSANLNAKSKVNLMLKKKLKEKNLKLRRQKMLRLHHEKLKKLKENRSTEIANTTANPSTITASTTLNVNQDKQQTSTLGSSSITISSDLNNQSDKQISSSDTFTLIDLNESILNHSEPETNQQQQNSIENLNFNLEKNDSNETGKCAVCGDNATSTRYGRLACEACIEFFRRNYPISKSFVCVKSSLPANMSSSVYQNNIANLTDRNLDEPCEINKDTRYKCRKCRMDKSIRAGLRLPNGSKILKKQTNNSEDMSFEEQLDNLINMDQSDFKDDSNESLESDDIEAIFLNNEQKTSKKSSFLTNSELVKGRISGLINEQNSPKCAVCSDVATGVRYGVFVCEGCKEFFRRQRENISIRPLECVSGLNDCEINIETRTQCKKCRFDKCIRLGMKLVGRYVKPVNQNASKK